MKNEKNKYRKSKQRNMILDYLSSKKHHPTATQIYDFLKNDFPSLSLGNVYRNLNILIETGKVKKIDAGSTFDRFEAVRKPHYHFICTSCGKVIDIEMEHEKRLNILAEKKTGFEISGHRIDFYGLCNECK